MTELTDRIAREHQPTNYDHVAEVAEKAVWAEATVTPSREDVARILNPAAWQGFDLMMKTYPNEESNPLLVEESLTRADQVLALFPGRSEAEVKAEALREAAGGLDLPGTEMGIDEHGYLDATHDAWKWLNRRADLIERGGDRG